MQPQNASPDHPLPRQQVFEHLRISRGCLRRMVSGFGLHEYMDGRLKGGKHAESIQRRAETCRDPRAVYGDNRDILPQETHCKQT